MTTIQDLLKHYSQIIDVIRRAGAQNVLIFKGFSPKEEHDLNILIMNYQTDNIGEHLTCEAHISEDLTLLLGCAVYVTNKHSMFYKQLNPSNSFELPLAYNPENIGLLASSLQRIFGTEWEFIKRDLYGKETTEEEWQRYSEEMESMKAWFGPDREADEIKVAETPRGNSAGFFLPQPAAAVEPVTVNISFGHGVVINKTFLPRDTPLSKHLEQVLSEKLVSAISDVFRQEGLTSTTPPPSREPVCGW